MLFKNDFENAINKYNDRLKVHGISQETLGWGKKGRAKLRFEILLSAWDFNNSSIMDFGCGFGDLVDYMDHKGITGFEYTGVDINEQLITIAREKHPQHKFILGDILNMDIKEKFDYILTSGVFNYKMSDNFLFIKSVFEVFAKLCTKGFAVNFLSNRVQFKEDRIYYADPVQILDLAYGYSNNVILRNDYMPYEFTVFVNFSSKIDKDYTVYEEYLKYV